MPVYVTRAHVTIGDAGKRHTPRYGAHRRAFHISDICRTPYCFRSFLVVFLGLGVVAGGVVMTIIGYKPTILLPWYRNFNQTNQVQNVTDDPTSVPRILGEPGPYRVLVYIGPILMGIGFFSMMMAIVLFCEIKDRYFNNILPKKRRRDPKNKKKEDMYAMIIDEFRKNYFRGIEVPLKRHSERKKTGKKFSISLSGSSSILSFGRRLSHDFQRRRRRSSRESQPERTASIGRKKSHVRRFVDPDSWLKTSSLPNIRHKDSFVELHNIYNRDTKLGLGTQLEAKSCGPQLDIFRITCDTSGVDNPAYRESPPDKRRRPALRKQRRVDNTCTSDGTTHVTSDGTTHVTTVMVHRESTNNEDSVDSHSVINLPQCGSRRPSTMSCRSEHGDQDRPAQNDEVINIDTDINLFDKCSEIAVTIPDNNPVREHREHRVNCEGVKINGDNTVCTCGDDAFCAVHTLGMDSGGSSLSLSWDNIPCVYNDARRNTEPFLLYAASHPTEEDANINTELLASQRRNSKIQHREVIKSKSTAFSRESDSSEESLRFTKTKSKSTGPFKTKINVFKSDSNLFRGRRYSIFDSHVYRGISTDSLDLTEEMLKNFEMAETAYI